MFDSLTRTLGAALKRLSGRGRMTEANIREALLEVKRALLDADVNYNVVNNFVNRVTERAVGQQVLRSLDPGEQIIGVVYEELVRLMGPVDHTIGRASCRERV